MPNPNRKTLLRALCLTAAGSALFASLHVGSTSAYFTSTATVQVADIQAGTWAGQSDAPEADSPVFLDEETIASDTLLAAAPAPAALTAEEPAATPSPTAEPTATPEPTAEPTPTPAATA
ncbi:SipW-dependent-type signal peptide-containing protein [uncultured Gemmiger sp.]|mgnify:CR=1 FL=1|uniref:SipW-dependent-type signal peptide-containing protein n=1 Tax=uncultured Gemmiger sp. TaxID=1623490 RepID=UPI00266DA410|nr:SipW-dependent-type signal peptide-containing protein [uncultured Gemmiger sp.]